MINKTAIGKALTEMISLADILYLAKKEVLSHTRNEEYLKTIVSMIEDARDALAAIEAEKPADTGTARLVAQSIIGMALADYSGLERQLENDTLISIEWIQQFAESYHAELCKKCKERT